VSLFQRHPIGISTSGHDNLPERKHRLGLNWMPVSSLTRIGSTHKITSKLQPPMSKSLHGARFYESASQAPKSIRSAVSSERLLSASSFPRYLSLRYCTGQAYNVMHERGGLPPPHPTRPRRRCYELYDKHDLLHCGTETPELDSALSLPLRLRARIAEEAGQPQPSALHRSTTFNDYIRQKRLSNCIARGNV